MSPGRHDDPPDQHAEGERCEPRKGGCGRLLSVYNPYRVCGPCRRRMERKGLPATWLRGARRPVVRRGPLGIGDSAAG